MTQYKQWFIDFGFERYYPQAEWFFNTWSGSFFGRPGQKIEGDSSGIPEYMGQEVETIAGIRILGHFARIGVAVTTYAE